MSDRESFRFVVEMAPPRAISPNGSRKTPGWKLGQIKDQWRQAWAAGIMEGIAGRQGTPGQMTPLDEPMFTDPVRLDMTYHSTNRATGGAAKDAGWDRDNLIAVSKWGIDQLQALRIVSNDRLIAYGTIEQIRTRAKAGYLVVTVTRMIGGQERSIRVREVLADLIAHCGTLPPESPGIIPDSGWWPAYDEIIGRLEPGDLEVSE